jgi:hypothetical protein
MIAPRLDPTMKARVVERRSLSYSASVSRQVGWGWVRAGSALARFGNRWVIVQDDALWLASWDERGDLLAQALPTNGTSARLFEDKRQKPDFEAAVVLGERLLVLGSGSLPARERVAVLEATGAARVVEASGLYAALRALPELSGGTLNVEGALLDGERIVLFSRGNAAALSRDGFDLSVELDASELLRYVENPSTALPTLHSVQHYRLGEVAGVRLTVTDVALREGVRYFIAAAEASPDAIADGAVLAASFGVLDGDPRYTLIEAEDGSPLREKVEGLAAGASDGAWLAVTDPDDASRPAQLLTLDVGRTEPPRRAGHDLSD